MRYLKETGAELQEYHGPAMGRRWYAANGWIGYAGTLPRSRLELKSGVIVELPEPELLTEWISKERFITALYALIPAEAVAALLTEPETLKSGVAALALLTTDAAPGGQINLRDERVAAYLKQFGLSLDEVRENLEEM